MSSRISEKPEATNGKKTSKPSWVGKRVGRFRLVSELGRGAMGRVFRAEDTLLQRQVALKVLPKMLRRGSKTIAVERLITEARAAATLEHPHVVNVYEVNESGGVYYIAMELLAGGSLRDIVKAAGPMDCARACLLCADAADALSQAHGSGIIHRDIKPANLMLTRNGRCKVADFGLARIDDAGDLSSILPESVGTPQFVAPELMRGIPASPRSDIYSLGATLWFLLTGHPPFEASTAAELLRQHLESPLPDLLTIRPDLPPGLAQAVSKAMSKRPADRFESALQFEKVLRVYTIPTETSNTSLNALMSVTEPVVPQETVVAPPKITWRFDWRFNWKRPPVLIGASAAAVLVLAMILVPLLRSHPAANSSGIAHRNTSTAALTDPEPAPEQPAVRYVREDARTLSNRGRTFIRQGQFADAAADFSRALEQDPTDIMNWYYRGVLAAYMGQNDVYRQTCKGMFQRFSSASNATMRDKTAKTCAIFPDSGIEPKDLVALTDTLPPEGNGSPDLVAWFHFCKGLARYRNGQFSECIELIQKAKIPDRVTRAPVAQLIEAMAQWRSGKRTEAQSTLRQATERLDQSLAKPGIDDLGRDGLEDWLNSQTLRRQAEAMILHGK